MCRIIPLHHPMWWQSVEPLSTVIRTATSSTSSTQNNMNTGGGGGTISPYEARPSYQNVISNLVGNFRGYPDVASDYCCAAIYLQGAWVETGGTSWATPTFAGTVSAAGHLGRTTRQALTFAYNEYATGRAYKGPFYDITTGDPNWHTGWDICAGIGSPRTYKGK